MLWYTSRLSLSLLRLQLERSTMSTYTTTNDYFDSNFPILGGVGNTGGDDAL